MRLGWRRKTARAILFHPESNLFLIAKSALPPFTLHLPGGGIDRNELPKDAIQRELCEELHIQPENILTTIYLGEQDECVMGIPHTAHIFVICIHNPTFILSWEIRKIQWVTWNELSHHIYLDTHIVHTLKKHYPHDGLTTPKLDEWEK
jgi:8-oxo-dGTP pyrophosphatase MutT (NUDIX family)